LSQIEVHALVADRALDRLPVRLMKSMASMGGAMRELRGDRKFA
jgi:hypothetical protein